MSLLLCARRVPEECCIDETLIYHRPHFAPPPAVEIFGKHTGSWNAKPSCC